MTDVHHLIQRLMRHPMHDILFLKFFLIVGFLFSDGMAAAQGNQSDTDKRVLRILNENREKWHDLNVPYEDGKVLHDLIVANNYRSALEIGTSTGHSTLWIAWALSKTGGKLTTIEIDERRQKAAIEILRQAGLSSYVNFVLGDAHQKVKEVPAPLDFVFSDADKDWYVQYFKDIHPKLAKGGTFTAHNVLHNLSGIQEFLNFVKAHPDYATTIDRTSRSGISISKKK
jgi:caffeoyl-CoA O-methyltransferase